MTNEEIDKLTWDKLHNRAKEYNRRCKKSDKIIFLVWVVYLSFFAGLIIFS